MADNDPSVEKQKLLDSWNPAPDDQALARLVGVPVEVGDTRATAHVPMEELNHHLNPADSGTDAALLYQDDGDGDDADEFEDMDKAALKAEAEKRDLPVSGSKEDLKARIREYDASAS